jgi:DNA-binding transcriptional LysR family regulator
MALTEPGRVLVRHCKVIEAHEREVLATLRGEGRKVGERVLGT